MVASWLKRTRLASAQGEATKADASDGSTPAFMSERCDILERCVRTVVPAVLSAAAAAGWQHALPTTDLTKVETLCRLLEALLAEARILNRHEPSGVGRATTWAGKVGEEGEEGKGDVRVSQIEALVAFAAVWAFGGPLLAAHRGRFSLWWREAFGPSDGGLALIGDCEVFDGFVDRTGKFVPWGGAARCPQPHAHTSLTPTGLVACVAPAYSACGHACQPILLHVCAWRCHLPPHLTSWLQV